MNQQLHVSNRGEIWLARLDPVEGNEQAGIRPVLVISGNRFNRMQPRLRIVLPLTTRDRGLPFHVRIEPPEGGVRVASFVLCDQPRTVATSRFVSHWGTVDDASVQESLRWLGDFLDLPA